MTSRGVAMGAAGLVAVLTAIDVAALRSLEAGGRFWYTGAVRMTLFLLVASCAAIAARRFGWWSQHLGRAWTSFFAGYAILFASEVVKRFFRDAATLQDVLVVVANVVLVVGYWLMSRSFRFAGLRYYGPRLRQVLFIVLIVALAALLAARPIIGGVQALGTPNSNPAQLLSSFADLITFLLAAPLLLMALELRGGHLFWMFGLLTAGTFGWMVNSGAARLFRSLGWEPAVAIGRNLGLAMACCFIAASALVLWLEVHRATRRTIAHA